MESTEKYGLHTADANISEAEGKHSDSFPTHTNTGWKNTLGSLHR